MRPGRKHVFGRFVCTLVVLLTGPLASTGAVFCLDGQIKIDSGSLGGKCSGCPNHHYPQKKEHSAATNTESCCIDIRTGSNPSIVSRPAWDFAEEVPAIFDSAPAFFNTAARLNLDSDRVFQTPMIPSSDLAITRTVVLLI